MSKRQKKMLIRIILSLALLIAAALLPLEGWPRIIAFMIPYVLCGWDVLYSAARGIARAQLFDEQFLMAIATIGAIALGDYAEAVSVMLFYQVGEWFQGMAVGKSRRDIAALMDIRPDVATVIRGGAELTVSPEEVRVGEIILIRPGEKIPLDGVIVEGATSVNTAALTGESLPQDKALSDRVISGTINLTGVIRVEVQSEFSQSTVSQILELVENSSAKKAHVESFVTRFAKYYTPCVVIGALLLAVIPPLLFGQSWSEWINRALIFLVVSCPCALVVSVPLSFFGGIGGASREGILIKGANYLEMLSKVKTAVFDKTGTLTQGRFAVTQVYSSGISKAELLSLAALAESNSSHPVAQSIVAAHGDSLDQSRLGQVTERPGLGVEAVIDGRVIYVGNVKLMALAGTTWRDDSCEGTVIHVAERGNYLGYIVVADEIKPDSKAAIEELKALGVQRVVLLTGDTKTVGEAVGRRLNIDEIHAELLPENKVSEVEKLLDPNAPLAFVGDGINDAPVLSRADVGIAMGALGSDAAIEAADVVLMDDKPSKLPKAVRIARKTMRIVRQNIVLALALKGAVLLLGALGLANMWLAVFADVGVMVLAIINAMRALRVRT